MRSRCYFYANKEYVVHDTLDIARLISLVQAHHVRALGHLDEFEDLTVEKW